MFTFPIVLIHFKPLKRGQPLYKGQNGWSQRVLYSEVPLYMYILKRVSGPIDPFDQPIPYYIGKLLRRDIFTYCSKTIFSQINSLQIHLHIQTHAASIWPRLFFCEENFCDEGRNHKIRKLYQ